MRRDGSVAVPPRYDWVGKFSDNRAAVRIAGLYGFVDEDGREVVAPQYRIVDDFKFGFAQIDVDGKSGLIDRDGKVVIEPKYGFVEAIGPDRFRVSEERRRGGTVGGEDFSGHRTEVGPSGSMTSFFDLGLAPTGVVDLSGRWIEPLNQPAIRFDPDDPSIHWVQKDRLWGLAHADGSWLIEPKFQQAGTLSGGLARVTIDGKVGFIDRLGDFVIQPVFDKAWGFESNFDRTSAERDGKVGVIDKSGAWVFQQDGQQLYLATATDWKTKSTTRFGWHFKQADRWGLLDLHGRVKLKADFDQSVQRCEDGRLVALKDKEWLYFEDDGTPLQPPDGRLIDAVCGSTAPYTLKIGDKFSLVDAHAKPVTPRQFEAIVQGGRDAKNVKLDGKWGRIGTDGHWLLEPKYDYISFGNDTFVASIDGKRGIMRADGSWMVEPKFDVARLRGDGTAFVTRSGATGVLRLANQSWAVPPRPGVMCDIAHAIMSQDEGKRAILSPDGDVWIDIGADRIGIILDYGLLTFLKDGKWGLIDTTGQVVVEPVYDEPVFFSPDLKGVAWAKRDGKWCAIDRRGRQVSHIPCTDAAPIWLGHPFECKVER